MSRDSHSIPGQSPSDLSGWKIDVSTGEDWGFNWATKSGLMVTFGCDVVVSEKRFAAYLRDMVDEKVSHALSISEGTTSLTSTQRKGAADIARDQGVRIAAVVDSPLTRGLITAISWLGANIKSFGPGSVVDAISYLGVPSLSTEEILGLIDHLRAANESAKKK